MNEEVKRFFASINFIYEENDFKNVLVKKVLLNKIKESFKVYLTNDIVLDFYVAEKLIEASKNGINGKACEIILEYDMVSDIDILNYAKILIESLH